MRPLALLALFVFAQPTFAQEPSWAEKGIAVLFAGSAQPIVVGAGRSIDRRSDDFAPLNSWNVYAKGPVERGADLTDPPTLRGDAILTGVLETSSAIIYWDGAAFHWYQQGD